MHILRLTQTALGEHNHRVEIRFESEPPIPVEFEFIVPDNDYGDIRWYMEEFLQYPMEPHPARAQNIEKRMREIGTQLYDGIFSTRDAIKLWGRLQSIGLNKVRVEILTSVQDAVSIPWELMCDPDTKKPLALETQAFVRAPVNPARLPQVIESNPDKVRILLVICRPNEEKDVPFRSVASRIIKGLDEDAQNLFELDVLRPPTFEQLNKTLAKANQAGKPYHIVHFDGHGVYLNSSELFKNWEEAKYLVRGMNFAPDRVSLQLRDGMHGYLAFENPNSEYNMRLVDGTEFGAALRNNNVSVLILNACRSAHADIQEKANSEEASDIHSQVRAFGSLAQEVMDAGVAGVVAMRYNVYVVTAAQFVADLYAALVGGQGFGEAVSMGRKQLAAQPLREIAFDPIPLQDWSVPVAYEAAPIQLFAKPSGAGTGAMTAPLRIDLSKKIRPEDNLPRPDVGFFGRDETILALDRAFDTQSVVLLNAYAGSGKTMTAAEFARWYAQTGGLRGPILFTSFEQYKPFTQILSAVEETYRPVLEQNNIQWLALSDEDRLNLTLQIFQQIPPLWIWDNVEPVNGFPAGADSAWSVSEQRELRTFLQIVTAQSQTKFLLTSRRDEREWLGDIPKRVTLPPMPMQERVRLTRALADKQGKRIADVKDWLPLRDGLETSTQVNTYLEKLHNGEQAFDDEASEGRSKSLGASLGYGFEQAFNADERKVLALLHFFQGFVDVDALRMMAGDSSFNEKQDWFLPEINGLTRETGIGILDKAADIGLLTSHGGGYYTIHPALPWFFKSLFEQYYPNETPPTDAGDSHSSSFILPPSSLAMRAYVETISEFGDYYHNQYNEGSRDVIAALRREEPNLLYARALARQYGWWDALTNTMQGLRQLYSHTGRRVEWKRLVEEIVPDFVGVNDLPLSGREEQWSIVTQYRVLLAGESHDWAKAEHLQHIQVDEQRRRAASLLSRPTESLSTREKHTLRTLAVFLQSLGNLQRELGKTDCISTFQEGYELSSKIGDQSAAVTAFNLGVAYTTLPTVRNLDETERWYRRSLELHKEEDRLGRGRCHGMLGVTAYEQFKDALKEKKPEEELSKHLNAAVNCYQQALALLPPDAVNDLAMTYRNLGNVYHEAGDVENSLENSNQSIHYSEMEGNLYQAGETRFNVAIMLANNGRLSDALLYARAALRNFESYGGRAKDMEDETKGLIADIEGKMKK